MTQNVIELSRYQPIVHERRDTPHRRIRKQLQNLLAAVELLVTAVIGICILFCMGLTVSMLCV